MPADVQGGPERPPFAPDRAWLPAGLWDGAAAITVPAGWTETQCAQQQDHGPHGEGDATTGTWCPGRGVESARTDRPLTEEETAGPIWCSNCGVHHASEPDMRRAGRMLCPSCADVLNPYERRVGSRPAAGTPVYNENGSIIGFTHPRTVLACCQGEHLGCRCPAPSGVCICPPTHTAPSVPMPRESTESTWVSFGTTAGGFQLSGDAEPPECCATNPDGYVLGHQHPNGDYVACQPTRCPGCILCPRPDAHDD